MLDIRPIDSSVTELKKILEQAPQSICVTSKHAVRMLAQQDLGRSIAVYAVGEATAKEATALGFSHVVDAGGNVKSLIEYIEKHNDPKRGTLLYARGVDVSADLAGALRGKGVSVREVVTYKAEFVDSFPQDYIAALKANAVDGVMFFSRRSAENYVRLAREHGLQSHEQCIAIGESYLQEILAPLRFRQIQPVL